MAAMYMVSVVAERKCKRQMMCEICEAMDRDANDVVVALSKVLTERGATNKVVLLASLKLLMSAVSALEMPPQVFLSMVCSHYSDATNFEVVPLQVEPVQGNVNQKPDGKLN
jgi:hypothetical protein